MSKGEWSASLWLEFALREEDNRTVFANRAHRGPLRVQKNLYPEDKTCCHTILLHPPGGIAGGDRLLIKATVQTGAQALITTPGATKWYRSVSRTAEQRTTLQVENKAILEWLPQENIFFNGTDASLITDINLAEDATFIGLESCCLGRIAADEQFDKGAVRLRGRLTGPDGLLWSEQALLQGGSLWLKALPGLGGCPFFATLLAYSKKINQELLNACRDAERDEAISCGSTLFPSGLLVARCLAYRAEPVQQWFFRLWSCLLPALIGRSAVLPRLWNT